MRSNYLIIKKKLNKFKKKINVDGDKSLSIRWVLLASQAIGKSRASNLLKSEDVFSAVNCLKKLGVKVKFFKNNCFIQGRGINGFKYKKKIILNAGNSGTVGRLILPLLIKSPNKIKIIGDQSLSKRDFSRVTKPLSEIGASFFPTKRKNLPISILGSDYLRPINYYENKGSAQCKTCIMLASLNTPGEMKIFARKSRDHTELMFRRLNIPINIKKGRKKDYIKVSSPKFINNFNFKVPGDISSASFFIVLTLLSKKSEIEIKNVNVNSSRVGIINILNKMGANIKLKGKKTYKGEKIANIHVKSKENLKAINCPAKLNSSAIDEFLIIFLVAAKSKGISKFKDLGEMNKKESKRLDLGVKFLRSIGIKVDRFKDNVNIHGNPNLILSKKFEMKNFLKDHRIFFLSCITALTLGGVWKIYDKKSANTSFPNFLKILKKIGAKVK